MSSYSSLKAFRECAWKRALNNYYKGIDKQSDALEFGECYHLCIEKGLEEGLKLLREKKLFKQEELLVEMYKRFATFIAKHNIKILENEVNFEISFEGYEDNPYVGYIDAVVLYNNEIYLAEFKTASYVSYEHVDVDSQLTSYLWACKMIDKYNPKGVIWIVNRKAIEKEPVILKNGDLSTAKNQGVFSETYKAKAKEIYGDNIPAKVEDFIKWLEQNDQPYICMVVTTRTEEELNSYGRLVEHLIKEETELLRDIEKYGIIAVKDKCYAFPTQSCSRNCLKKDVCFALLREKDITEDEASALKDVFKEEVNEQ